MKILMTEDSIDDDSKSYLLDDDSRYVKMKREMFHMGVLSSYWLVFLVCSIPFSVDDLSLTLQEKDFSDVKPAAELLENPDFQFLQE